MELADYLAVVRRRWLSILIVVLLTLGAAITATVLTTPSYTARSQVYVSVRSAGTATDLLQGSSYTQRQVKSYTDLVTTPRVLVPVIEHLDLPTTPDVLARSVSTDSPLDTSLINIRVTDVDPVRASDVANAIADSLADQVADLERPDDGPSPVQISTVRTATPPVAPSSPNATRNVALGLLLGCALGFGLAVLREVLDTRVRTSEDVRALTDVSVMTVVPEDDEISTHRLVVRDRPQGVQAEAFRRLRTNLQFLDVADRLETIVVTSSVPREGKSTTAINLSITLADAGARVVLVDADLRRPSVAEYMGIEGGVGVTTILIGRATIDDVVQPWGNGSLHVLPAGQVPPNPSEMTGSRAMAWLLGELVKRYDVVVIDTPPLLPVTDAAILARLTGGALVVAGAKQLHRNQLAEALTSLEAVGARVLGVVVNQARRAQSEAYAYYGRDGDLSTTPPGRFGRAGRAARAAGGARAGRGPTPRPPRSPRTRQPDPSTAGARPAPSNPVPPGPTSVDTPGAPGAATPPPRRSWMTAEGRADGRDQPAAQPPLPAQEDSFDAILGGVEEPQVRRRVWPGAPID